METRLKSEKGKTLVTRLESEKGKKTLVTRLKSEKDEIQDHKM